MDYLDDELNSDAIEALQPSSDEPSSSDGNNYIIIISHKIAIII